MDMQEAIYGLPQVGVLAQELLAEWLKTRVMSCIGYGSMSGGPSTLHQWLMTLWLSTVEQSM